MNLELNTVLVILNAQRDFAKKELERYDEAEVHYRCYLRGRISALTDMLEILYPAAKFEKGEL